LTPAPLDLDLLLKAYAAGIFPMADERHADDVYWVEPQKRGILPLGGFHLSRSLAKSLKSNQYETTADADFLAVVRACAASVETRPSTWINGQIEEAVTRLHALGRAHSIEIWDKDVLVGGLYGIALGRAFFGESMFSRATDASKFALAHLVARLRAGGFTLLDCQFITPHLASLGAIEIDREDYLKRLAQALSPDEPVGNYGLYSGSPPSLGATSESCVTMVSLPTSGWRIWHSLTQTS
jgi:leucyl/phenylalanyl-tRNA---protein transferase